MSDLNIAVLGAGVVGLTTAVELQKQFRNATVEVIADKFNKETTSYVAAGLFRPGTHFSGPTKEITQKWINESYRYWDSIQNSVEGCRAGVTQVSGYIFSSEHSNIVRNAYIENLVPLYRRATEEELRLCPGAWKYGSFFTTVLTDCSTYLPWTIERFQNSGGEIIHKTVRSFADLPEKYSVIVNCTGLGSKWLCNDDRLVPMCGQVLKVEAPFIKTFFYGDYDTYIIPGFNSVTLGGCRQYDSYNLNINKYDTLSIKERCEKLVPSLKTAKFLEARVGLRPHRETVRVERELKILPGRKLKIVHNYGHGGYGVTTAPGTALYCVDLVKESLLSNSKL